jgi:hypothetical protein
MPTGEKKEIDMKIHPFARKSSARLISAGIGCMLLFGAGVASANGERISLTWVDDASGAVFEVTSPSAAPLSAVVKRVVAEIDPRSRCSKNYQVEQVVVTGSLPSRDPDNPGHVIFTPVEETVVLDSSLTLAALGLNEGDTLRLVQLESDKPGKAHRGGHKGRMVHARYTRGRR